MVVKFKHDEQFMKEYNFNYLKQKQCEQKVNIVSKVTMVESTNTHGKFMYDAIITGVCCSFYFLNNYHYYLHGNYLQHFVFLLQK